MEHHELLISYIRHRLQQLPSGSFGMHRGKNVIYISKDPTDPSVTPSNRKRIVCDTSEGMVYAALINERNILKKRLAELTYEWNRIYRIPPSVWSFPLRKKKSSYLDTKLYTSSINNQNTHNNETPIVHNGQMLRSKNELLACQVLDERGYAYKSEIVLTPDGFNKLYPDITFYIPEVDKPVALEIDGAMDNISYCDKAGKRKDYYLNAGLIEFTDVIFLRIGKAFDFDPERLNTLIDTAIAVNIRNIDK